MSNGERSEMYEIFIERNYGYDETFEDERSYAEVKAIALRILRDDEDVRNVKIFRDGELIDEMGL